MIPSIPEIFSQEGIVDVAEVNQWLGESGRWLENVDLVLASQRNMLAMLLAH